MDGIDRKASWKRIVAAIVCAAAALAFLALWWFLKVRSMHWTSGISLFPMPLLMGVTLGILAQRTGGNGGWWSPIFVSLVTLCASLLGIAIQHYIDVAPRLKKMAAVAYDETVAYAEDAIWAMDDEQLRGVIASNQVAVVGMIASSPRGQTSDQFRAQRVLAHINWIASRQMTLHGQGGRDRTLLEATRVVRAPYLLRDLVRMVCNQPIPDEELADFQIHELPMLREILDGRFTRAAFEQCVIETVQPQLTLKFLMSRGFGPGVGFATLIGAICAYRLTSPRSESEEVV
jgi:hypothetical protein